MSIEMNTTFAGGLVANKGVHKVMGFYINTTISVVIATICIYKDEATATADPENYIEKFDFKMNSQDMGYLQSDINSLSTKLEEMISQIDPVAERAKKANNEPYDAKKAGFKYNYKQNGTRK